MTDARPTLDLTGTPPGPGAPVSRTAICCSGGGIRSASFNLGALQELAARGIVAETDDVCAVSGGSYIAASHAIVAHTSTPRPAIEDVYRPGSPEEKWLRGNSRYLLPNAKVALVGALRLVFGIFVNLVLVLAWLFIIAHVVGWILEGRGWLTGLAIGAPRASVGLVWVVPVVLVGATFVVVLALGQRLAALQYAWWAMLAAIVVAVACLGAPRAIATLYDTGIDNSGNVGTVVRGLGFASPAGCAQARETETDPTRAVCGERTPSMSAAASNAPKDPQGQGAGFLAFVAALAALVRLALGKLRGESAPSDSSSWIGSAIGVVRRTILPWLGSLAVGALLAIFTLRWIGDGAIRGYGAGELVKVLIVGAAIVIFRFTVDVNHTSMHGFYRDRLAVAYAVRRSSESTVTGCAETRTSDLGVTRPQLVVCAAANVNVGVAGDEVPPGRDAISFTFTPTEVGLSARAPSGTQPDTAGVPGRQDVFVPTKTYEQVVGRTMTLLDAVALSGAAVSPLMGKMTRPAQRFLFSIANVRLGLWLPNPRLVALAADPQLPTGPLSWVDSLRVRAYRARLSSTSVWSRAAARVFFRATQPNLRLLMAEAFGHQRVRTSWLYVTDGGHFENLGLVEALRRGATEVYVFDASGDSVTSWNTLGEAIALARSELGVDFDIDPSTMVRDGVCVEPFVHGTFSFAWDARRPAGIIHLCKLGVWPGAPWDVHAYASRHATFPTDSTLQQMYDDEEFEAYRALGRSATAAMLDALTPPPEPAPHPRRPDGDAGPRDRAAVNLP